MPEMTESEIRTLARAKYYARLTAHRAVHDVRPEFDPEADDRNWETTTVRIREECLQTVSALFDCIPPTETEQARKLFRAIYADRFAPAIAALEQFQSYGCPHCNGDCSAANPPVALCPMQMADKALHKARGEP